MVTSKYRGYKRNLRTVARYYSKNDIHNRVNKAVIELSADLVLSSVSRSSEVVEMGYGLGVWTRKVLQHLPHTTIIDGSASLLSQASRSFGSRITTAHALFEEFSPVKKYDHVFCTYVLEHVLDPVMVLKSVRKWLAPGGLLHILVPNAGSLHRRLAVQMGIHKELHDLGRSDRRLGHHRVYTLDRLIRDVRASGLVVKKKRGMFVKLVPLSQMGSFSMAQLRGLLQLSEQMPIEYCASLYLVASRSGK